jgi:hypothetical protein
MEDNENTATIWAIASGPLGAFVGGTVALMTGYDASDTAALFLFVGWGIGAAYAVGGKENGVKAAAGAAAAVFLGLVIAWQLA